MRRAHCAPLPPIIMIIIDAAIAPIDRKYTFPIIRVIHIRAINYRSLIRCNEPSLLVPRLDYNSGRVFDHLVAGREREGTLRGSRVPKYPDSFLLFSICQFFFLFFLVISLLQSNRTNKKAWIIISIGIFLFSK